MDDAFAGGVCRCQHCGTIQTVPSAPKPTHTASAGGKTPVAQLVSRQRPKALYQQAPPAGNLGSPSGDASGLEDLAQALASSGLHSSHLRKPIPRAKSNRTLWIVLAAVGVLVVVGIIVAVVRKSPGGASPTTPSDSSANTSANPNVPAANSATPTNPPAHADGAIPTFLDIPLSGPSTIYLLDRGQGTGESFDAIKGGTAMSIQSLDRDGKFLVIFWQTENLVCLPSDSLQYATATNKQAACKGMADVFFFGQSDIGPAMEKALSLNPAEIVLVSGKSDLDEEFAKKVMDLRKDHTVKIHTISTGRQESAAALEAIAKKTGGQFRQATSPQLREMASNTPS